MDHPLNRDSDLRATAERLRARVFERKPILGAIIEKLGQKSLIEYVRGYVPVDMHPLMTSRREEFLDTFRLEAAEMFAAPVVDCAVRQLRRNFFVSTNDHHGPLNAFDAFNAHVILALAAMEDPSLDRTEAIILLSCSNISFNNVSFPRGVLYSAYGRDGVRPMRLSLLPSKLQTCALYGYQAYGSSDVTRALSVLRDNEREGFIAPAVAEKLREIVSDVFGDPAILKRKTYSAQASMINLRLWETVFRDQRNVPPLVSVGIERLVARLLMDHHLGRDTLLHRFLFDPAFVRAVSTHFDGIYGAFSLAEHSGTYLFWGRDAATKRRIRLSLQGGALVADDESLRIDWTPDAVAEALRSRTILPSMLMIYVTLAFYYGLKCLGGYSQVNYLTFMKQAFVTMLRSLGETETADACDPVSTKQWSGFSFAYASENVGPVVPAQFLDLHLYGDDAMWSCLRRYANVCTLKDAVEPILPEIYRYSYPESERESDLLSVTPQDLTALAGLKPCVRIR